MPTPAPASAPRPTVRIGRAAAVFAALRERLHREGVDATRLTQVLQFNLSEPPQQWVVDFGGGEALVRRGTAAQPTAVFELEDEHLLALAKGEVEPGTLYEQGKLRVEGELRLAHELGFLTQREEGKAGAADSIHI